MAAKYIEFTQKSLILIRSNFLGVAIMMNMNHKIQNNRRPTQENTLRFCRLIYDNKYAGNTLQRGISKLQWEGQGNVGNFAGYEIGNITWKIPLSLRQWGQQLN